MGDDVENEDRKRVEEGVRGELAVEDRAVGPKKSKIETEAGILSPLKSSTKGTKKFPHACVNTKMNTTPMPARMSGSTIWRSARRLEAPSTHAASSSETGTESMKFFSIQIAIGSEVAVMNRITPICESRSLICTKRA